VLLDTAGRMQNNSNLMDENGQDPPRGQPDLCVFVGDSLAGNDAVEQARKFDEIVDVGGVILTKVDVDAKGGAALSVAYTINKPLLFVGVGQNYPTCGRSTRSGSSTVFSAMRPKPQRRRGFYSWRPAPVFHVRA